MQNVLYFIKEKKLSEDTGSFTPSAENVTGKTVNPRGFFLHSAELGQRKGKATHIGNTKETPDLFHIKSLSERSF